MAVSVGPAHDPCLAEPGQVEDEPGREDVLRLQGVEDPEQLRSVIARRCELVALNVRHDDAETACANSRENKVGSAASLTSWSGTLLSSMTRCMVAQ